MEILLRSCREHNVSYKDMCRALAPFLPKRRGIGEKAFFAAYNQHRGNLIRLMEHFGYVQQN